MTRTYAKPGDIVDCPLVRKPVTIEKIYSQDYYGPAKDEGWQIEFEDTTGEYRAWKQRWDGGKLIMLGTKENPYVDYKTRKELLKLISDAAAQDDQDLVQTYNDILDDLLAATFGRDDANDWVMTVCNECVEYKPCLREELLDCETWTCERCDADPFERIDREADEYYDGGNFDPNAGKRWTRCDEEDGYCPYDANSNEDCRNYCGLGVDEDEPDYDEYDDDDDDDYSQNMPCDNTGYCAGDSCREYYNCQVHHDDK